MQEYYVIVKKDNSSKYFKGYNSQNQPLITDIESEAVEYESETQAMIDVNIINNFWGARPERKQR